MNDASEAAAVYAHECSKLREQLATKDEECKRLEARVKELQEALLAAGKSLRTLANTAGTKDALLEDFTQVRGYANSRAIVVERIFAPNEGGE